MCGSGGGGEVSLGEDDAEEKLPCSERGAEEGGVWIGEDRGGCGEEAEGGEEADGDAEGARAEACGEEEQEREEEIELLFDAERPGVEKGLGGVGGVEVAMPAP